MPHYERELALVPVQSSQLHARIRSVDTADALAMPGVLARLDRCRGRARLQLVELFTTETVLFVGQIIGVISADNSDIIIKLARKVCVYYYFIQHIQLHDCIQELFLMITCMSAVVRDVPGAARGHLLLPGPVLPLPGQKQRERQKCDAFSLMMPLFLPKLNTGDIPFKMR